MQTTPFSLFLLAGAASLVTTTAQINNRCYNSFNLDCGGCTRTPGCFYCPADGICFSNPSFSTIASFSRCSADEFVSDSTCSSTDLYRSVSDGSDRNTPFYNDPLYSANAWVFEMINLIPAWEKGYTGAGVHVRINDGGTDINHPEFNGRFDMSKSCRIFFPNSLTEFAASHGTNVASIVGASGNDGCSVGIAPEVEFSACNFFNHTYKDMFGSHLDTIDIMQNSFGPIGCAPFEAFNGGRRDRRELQSSTRSCPFVDDSANNAFSPFPFPCDVCDFSRTDLGLECENSIITHCQDSGFGKDQLACLDYLELFVDLFNICIHSPAVDAQSELLQASLEGRDGKGSIFVFASGNEASEGGNVNLDGILASRFTIPVGATSPDDRRSAFSTGGAALMVAAPGGSQRFLNDFVGAGLRNSCEAISEGTSFSAPVVTGVIALMLEANPNLTWRDAQAILAKTSRIPNFLNSNGQVVFKSDTAAGAEFVTKDAYTNAAGFTHSYGYGFGIVDAGAAVEAAENWKRLDFERRITLSSQSFFARIADDSSRPTNKILTIGTELAGNGFILESVSVQLFFQFPPHGDLRITLTSPQGTESILAPGNRNLFSELSSWTLTTVRTWGESPVGEWTLTISDTDVGNANHFHDGLSTLTRWRLTAYGRGGGVAPYTVAPPTTSAPTAAPTSSPVAAISIPAAPSSGGSPTVGAPSPISATDFEEGSGASSSYSRTLLLLLSTSLALVGML